MAEDFSSKYSEESLRKKLARYAKTAGSKVVYAVLLLYNVLIDNTAPLKARLTIVAALGYFIFPLDALPDLTPVLGYTDDLGVLIFALTQVASCITPAIREKARKQLGKWFDTVDENDLNEVDKKIE